jgi:hypothetical protein
MRKGFDVHGRGGAAPGALERHASLSRRAQLLAALVAVAAAVGIYAGVQEIASHGGVVSAAGGSARAHGFRAQGLLAPPSAAQGEVAAAAAANDPAYGVAQAGAGLRAYNPVQRVTSRFTAAGAAIASGATHVTLRLAGIGYASALHGLPTPTPTAHANRATYALPGVSEWFANGLLGLEQGFTVGHAPATHGASGPLTLAIALAGSHARMEPGGGVQFQHPGGPALRYAGLSASDATGRALRSWMELSGGRLLLRIDAAGARFPLHVDPYIQQAELSDGGTEGFGTAVAISADDSTALIADPNAGIGEGFKGRGFVYTRSGSTWSQQAVLSKVKQPNCGRKVALSRNGNVALLGCGPTLLLFTRSGSTWTEGEVIPVTNRGEAFALTPDGSTLLVGDTEAGAGAGEVVTLHRSGSTWTQEGTPTTVSGTTGFGGSVAISGDASTALMATERISMIEHVYKFVRSGENWTEQGEQVTTGVGTESTVSLALDEHGDVALIGGTSIKPYIHSGETWTEGEALKGVGGAGVSVALSSDGNTAVVGEPTPESQTGAAYMFRRSGETWTELERLPRRTKPFGGHFGEAAGISGSGKTALVGEPAHGFAVIYRAAPEVTKVVPNHGPLAGGTTVELVGTNFRGATSVDFGATEATGVTVNSDESITATVPAGTGTVDVTVNDAEGVGRVGVGDKFTYGPLVSGVSPNEGATAGGTEVVITGGQFSGVTAVHFGANEAVFTVESEETIHAVVPKGVAGTVDVTVTTGEGTSPAMEADHYRYVAAPTVTKVKLNKGVVGGDNTVTITGTSFRHVGSVSFGATPAAGYTVVSETSITATVPAVTNAGKVNVIVTAEGGTSLPATTNVYGYTPQITGLSPNAGPVAGGTPVKVTGAGFAVGTKGTVFKFGTTRATSVNCTSTTECTLVAPAHVAGTVDVLATANKETSPKEATDKYTYS